MSLTSDLTAGDLTSLRGLFDPGRWATQTAKIRLPKTGPLDLERRPFLKSVFRDMSDEIVFMKGAQMGVTTTALVRALWMMDRWACSVIYTFPTRTDVQKLTQARINPVIRMSPYLLAKIVDVDSVMLKQFRVGGDDARSTIYFTGSMTEKDAVSVDADLLIHDEEDLSNPQIIEQFEGRLDASSFQWKFRLSTPRIPGAGIDRVFQTTDKRRWLIRCPSCNEEFEMGFPGGPQGHSNIEPDPRGWGEVEWARWDEQGQPARFMCHRCDHELSDEDRAGGRWVAERPLPGRPHGYAISQLAAPWITARRIITRFRKATWESDFWNLVVGIPWEEGTNAMTEAAIRDRCDPERPMDETGSGTTMGVDVGARMHVVIGAFENEAPRTIWFGAVSGYPDLDALMRRFGVVTAVIDAAPEEHATRDWAKKWNPKTVATASDVRVWRCAYSTPKPGQTAVVVWNEKTQLVTVPRTEMLSRSASELLSDRVLPRFEPGHPAWIEYVQHHANSKKVPIFVEGLVAERIIDHYEWHEVGPDHLFHAGTYEMVAREAPRGGALPSRAFISTRRRQERSIDVERPDDALRQLVRRDDWRRS